MDSRRTRFFVAISLSSEAKDQVVRAQPSTVPGVRLIGRDELHLTLHFLGEVAREDHERLRSALASVRAEAFTVALQGVGWFPPDGEPQVLWAGVVTSPSLSALRASIATALGDAIGFEPRNVLTRLMSRWLAWTLHYRRT